MLYTEPSVAEGKLVLHDDESLVREIESASLVIGDKLDAGKGSLILTSRRLVFLPDSDRSKGYETPFRDITMHAISRDPDSTRGPCIYAQIEGDFFEGGSDAGPMTTGGEGEGDDSLEPDTRGDDYEAFTEVRLYFASPDHLQTVFQDLCDCAALNPDSDEGEEEDGEGEGWFFNEAEVMEGAGAEGRAAMLARLEDCLVIGGEDDEAEGEEEEDGDARFENADERR